jgi:hypothetical protein
VPAALCNGQRISCAADVDSSNPAITKRVKFTSCSYVEHSVDAGEPEARALLADSTHESRADQAKSAGDLGYFPRAYTHEAHQDQLQVLNALVQVYKVRHMATSASVVSGSCVLPIVQAQSWVVAEALQATALQMRDRGLALKSRSDGITEIPLPKQQHPALQHLLRSTSTPGVHTSSTQPAHRRQHHRAS